MFTTVGALLGVICGVKSVDILGGRRPIGQTDRDKLPLIPKVSVFAPFSTEKTLLNLFKDMLPNCHKEESNSKKKCLPKEFSATTVVIDYAGKSKCLSLKAFKDQMMRIIKLATGKDEENLNKKTSEILTSIFYAWEKHSTKIDELVIFTSIAMHNTSYFQDLNDLGKKSKTIAKGQNRGLMQIESEKYYKRLTEIYGKKFNGFNCLNFSEEPYVLSEYSVRSIEAEFVLFDREFYAERAYRGCGIIELFCNAVIAMGSDEKDYMKRVACAYEGCIHLSSSLKFIDNELAEKAGRRWYIFEQVYFGVQYAKMKLL